MGGIGEGRERLGGGGRDKWGRERLWGGGRDKWGRDR